MTIKKKILIAVQFFVMAVIIAALAVANYFCFANASVVTAYLCGFGLDDDSDEAQEARQEGNLLAAGVMEDGAVLLKNENKALPLEIKKVNVFGWAGTDKGFIPQGTGSGTGARNDYVTFLGGLEAAGIEYNKTLANDYAGLNMRRVENESGNYTIEASTPEQYKLNYGVIEAEESFLTDARIQNAKEYSDNAVIVIGRLLGEGNDYSKKQYIKYGDNDETRKLQSISVMEQKMIDKVCENFGNVIVVINSTNPMEAGFLNNERIDAAIYMGTPGTRGAIGLANLLSGEAGFSGHLTDTWAYDLSTAASYATSGREGVGRYTDTGKLNTAYSDYIEDIYIGYKWYETADAVGFWNGEKAKQQWNIQNGYKDVVQFPFGFGLSYTTFKWEIQSLSLASGSTLKKDDYISLEVKVTNTGSFKGRDVVQLYYSAPYTDGGIEKSSISLLAFAKTIELKPGEDDTVYLEFPVEDMKSYDCYDRNNNGFMGYELEEGKYTLSLRTDVHTAATVYEGENAVSNEIEYTVPAGGFKYEKDNVNDEVSVVNRFTNYTNPVSGATSTVQEPVAGKAHSIDGNDESTKITYLTRSNFAGTFPYVTPENRAMGQLKDDTMYVTVTPATNADDVAPETNSTATKWTMEDMLGVEYDDPMWNEIVSQMSLSEQTALITRGGFGTIAVDSIGLKSTVAADGPSGFNNQVIGQNNLKAVNYPGATVIGQTWDFDIAYSVGLAIGGEGAALGTQGWYGPGANLHRSPLGGRNFEYYSEDARLSGIMVANEVMGAKEKGITAYIKHIAVNDSDTGRNGAYKWLTEQTFRENYLLPFELAVKVGYSNGMMSSVDRVGSTRVSGSYSLLTSVLREEWGFKGTVITDYYQSSDSSRPLEYVHDVDECIRAGNDMLLHPDGLSSYFDDVSSNTAKKMIAKSVKDILFTYADSTFFAEIAGQDVSFKKTPEVYAWWKPALISADVLVVLVCVAWGVLIFLLPKRKKAAGGDTESDAPIFTESAATLVAEDLPGDDKVIDLVAPVGEKKEKRRPFGGRKREPAPAPVVTASNDSEVLKEIGELKAQVEALTGTVSATVEAVNAVAQKKTPKKNAAGGKPAEKRGPTAKQQIGELKAQVEELRELINDLNNKR